MTLDAIKKQVSRRPGWSMNSVYIFTVEDGTLISSSLEGVSFQQ
jgi:hypothetical protein